MSVVRLRCAVFALTICCAIVPSALARAASPAAAAAVRVSSSAARTPVRPVPPDDAIRRPRSAVPHDSQQVTRARAGRTRVTRVLVILAYWGRHDSVTRKKAAAVLARDNAWYRAASYGRQGISGTATPWVKVPRQQCTSFAIFPAAERAAKRLHYNARRYQRVIIYEPCLAGYEVGLGQEPGSEVLLMSGGMDLSTTVHEQGHNYGLDHANLLGCTLHGLWVTYSRGANCAPQEYEDYTSAMALDIGGNAYAGDFSAPQKAQLGWLTGHLRTVAGNGSFVLSPYETTPGVKALRVPGSSGRTYWVEDRTARGNDTHMPAGDHGVMLHVSVPSKGDAWRSVLLDAVPHGLGASGDNWFLPPGSSWTSVEGIRFTNAAQTSGAARIVVTRHVVARAPGAVSRLAATPGDGTARITFTRAADNGNVVRSYQVTATPAGQRTPVKTVSVSNLGASTVVAAGIAGLRNGASYTFSVRARNDLGFGPVTSSTATPMAFVPSVAITGPANGADVSGNVTISALATPNARSRSPINELDVLVDGRQLNSIYNQARGSVVWDTGYAGAQIGMHTITVRAIDGNGRAAATSIGVDLTAVSAPALTVSSPAANATVQGQVLVSGTAAPYGQATLTAVYVSGLGDEQVIDTPAAGQWSVYLDSTLGDQGPQDITVEVDQSDGRSTVVTRHVTVMQPPATPPELTGLSPGSQRVSDVVEFTATATNGCDLEGVSVEVAVDGQDWDSVYVDAAARSSATMYYDLDTGNLDNGTHTITFTPTDETSTSGPAVSATVDVEN